MTPRSTLTARILVIVALLAFLWLYTANATKSATPAPEIGTALVGGYIGWAEPELGPNYLATRFPRGTLVRICAVECILRTTTDFGPSAAIDPPRIADLSVLDWESICGLPRSRGLCLGTVETVADVLPATDSLPEGVQ